MTHSNARALAHMHVPKRTYTVYYTHTNTHTYTHTCTHTHVHAHTRARTHKCAHTYLHTNDTLEETFTLAHTHVPERTYTHITYTKKIKHTHTQGSQQTGRQIEGNSLQRRTTNEHYCLIIRCISFIFKHTPR